MGMVSTASARSSIARHVASAEEETGRGKLCGNNLIFFATRYERVSGTYTVKHMWCSEGIPRYQTSTSF